MNNKDLCIIFVEGDAEEILFNKLKQIYLSEGCRCDIKVINMNAGGYANQVAGKLRGLRQNDKYKDCNFKVVCCEYDTDVYEKLQKKNQIGRVYTNRGKNFILSNVFVLRRNRALSPGC